MRLLLAAALGLSIAVACSLSGLSDGKRDASATGGSAGQDCVDASGSTCDAGGTGGTAGSDAADAALTHCEDGQQNDDETDVDCGGSCAPCPIERVCKLDADCRTAHCEKDKCVCPPSMVAIPTPLSDGIPYCVDVTEVTNAKYATFLSADAGLSNQPAECAWNDDFSPPNFDKIATANPELPVVNVDWCDAWAYCASVGKRLCGKLGGGGHPFTLPQSATSEWYVACSKAGTKTYVYGSTHDPNACVALDYFDGGDGGMAFPVGTNPGCEGGYPGIFDMNGNVWEWEYSCVDSDGGDASVTQCRRRGGSFSDTMYCARCSACGSANRPRSTRSSTTGIRCCAG